jgi:hypothetical protein
VERFASIFRTEEEATQKTSEKACGKQSNRLAQISGVHEAGGKWKKASQFPLARPYDRMNRQYPLALKHERANQ